jgi:hypothetical protein
MRVDSPMVNGRVSAGTEAMILRLTAAVFANSSVLPTTMSTAIERKCMQPKAKRPSNKCLQWGHDDKRREVHTDSPKKGAGPCSARPIAAKTKTVPATVSKKLCTSRRNAATRTSQHSMGGDALDALKHAA